MAPARLKAKLLAFDTRTKKNPASTVRPAKKLKKPVKPKRSLVERARSTSLGVVGGSDNDMKPSSPYINFHKDPPLRPKVEYSPNSMAKCQGCRKKIQKGHKRFGIPEKSDRYSKEIFRYYHVRCCPDRHQAKVPHAQQQLARQKQLERTKEQVVEQRQDLFRQMKKLRLMFANRLEVPNFMVFSNEVLKELVVKLPRTPAEMLEVHGIGNIKLQSFGQPFLTLMEQYRRRRAQEPKKKKMTATKTTLTRVKSKQERTSSSETQQQPKKRPVAAAAAKVEVIAIDCDDEEDDCGGDREIYMGATLTCEQLVQQKFDHAAANGYVISVD